MTVKRSFIASPLLVVLCALCSTQENITVRVRGEEKLVANETLGYFMAQIQMFLVRVGVDHTCLQFRQHLSNEMARYACDCWDAECKTSNLIGLSASLRKVSSARLSNRVLRSSQSIWPPLVQALNHSLKTSLQIKVEEATASVIEPSFGIGRIMYTIFEHNFKTREGDEQRTVDGSSGSIGRRYAHGAEKVEELPPLVRDLSQNCVSWVEALEKYPLFEQQEATK